MDVQGESREISEASNVKYRHNYAQAEYSRTDMLGRKFARGVFGSGSCVRTAPSLPSAPGSWDDAEGVAIDGQSIFRRPRKRQQRREI